MTAALQGRGQTGLMTMRTPQREGAYFEQTGQHSGAPECLFKVRSLPLWLVIVKHNTLQNRKIL